MELIGSLVAARQLDAASALAAVRLDLSMLPAEPRRRWDALRASKRGGDPQRIELTGIELPQDDPTPGLSIATEALDRLGAIDPRMADVFSLRAFAGLAFDDIGVLRHVSRSTVQRDFDAACAYLLNTLDCVPGAGGRRRGPAAGLRPTVRRTAA